MGGDTTGSIMASISNGEGKRQEEEEEEIRSNWNEVISETN